MKVKLFITATLISFFITHSYSQVVYTLSSCSYAPIAGTGTALPLCDDCMSGMIPIGFTFNFYGNNYTTADVSSNGFLTFSAGMLNGCCAGQVMPVAAWPTMIAFSWDDMYSVGGNVNYFTTGTAPNRIFVLNYNSVGWCCASSNMATVQIQLYETTNEIRILSANNNHTGRTATMGIQSIGNGTVTVPGRNSASWAATNECQSFTLAPPPNDDPCSAINLPIYGSCFYSTYTNIQATATAGVPAPGCAGYLGGDVWFRITVPASGSLTFDTQTGVMLDGGMAIYSGASCSALTLVACDDDNSPNGSMPMIALTGQTPGTFLWARVWENGNNNNGTFGICVTDPTQPPPLMGNGSVYIRSTQGSPWGSTSNEAAMNTVFGAGAWQQAYFETLNPATTFTTANCFIFIEGGDFIANEMNTFITTNMTTIQNWVAMGGHLLMNSAPNEGGNMNYGFGGVTLNYNGSTSLAYNGNTSAGQAGHPVFNGPHVPAGTSYAGNYFAHGWISGGGTMSLIEDAPGPSLTQKNWGSGRVMFGGMTTPNWHTPTPNGDNLAANIIGFLSNCLIPLPVELASFTGDCSDNGTLLKWQTASETNNASFTVEASTDAVHYVQEATISGAGNSNQLVDYSYLSPFRSYPGNYFRLIQKDWNGIEKVYPPIYVSCHGSNNGNCAVVHMKGDRVELSIYSAKEDVLHCTLTDMQGKIFETTTQQVQKGTSTIYFDGVTLSPGVYVLVINGSDSQCSNKFIRQ